MQARAEVGRKWPLDWGGDLCNTGCGELGAFSMCSQNSKVLGISKLKPDLSGCYKTIYPGRRA